ncbi:MAG: TonB-dependent hemoglobin/transferrin/lactoferrin family receptor [Gammaproteobacteria bacterium]|nr:TonB-dependent hemoglobin/transferrin/lactoferrin family receptor [Gammaproteobacteria bacterium]MBT8111887.1 TonB-dependent hemoglobin/transferrin/lactoferrin family receptor [Gammaproteobacteria bacterium]NND46922.1 TonB-dependent hemoglobin/transferrin/lactoferrin family receptor [Woeseiaceae bacterium]NNL46586.1 TonB-dependent hemoglobin/transferrin/lactoferrin family receptor [Woeseiaceae bacterium]
MHLFSLRFESLAAASAAGFFLCTVVAANAQQETGNGPDDGALLDQVVVVANKDKRSIREIAANVTVLSRADLSDQLATSLSDIFRYVPGVDYEAAGARFGTEGINIRGIGGNRVAILVDGVPLTDQFDTGSFSNATRDFIDAGLVQSIEVLHGPASALYGSAAIGGVVAVRTPDPGDLVGDKGFGGDFLGTWRDADQSRHAQAMVALGDRSLGLMAGVSWRDGEQLDSAAGPEGIDTKDQDRRTALIKFVADDPWGRTWRASVIHQDSHTLSDLNSVLGKGRYRSTTALEGDDSYDMDVINLAYEFGSPGGWIDAGIVRAFYETADIDQYTLDERAAASTPVSIDRFFSYDQEIRGVELNLWKNFSSEFVSHRLGFGLEYRDRHTEEYRDGLSTDLATGSLTNILLGEVFPLRDFPVSKTTETAAFVEDTISVGDWTIVAAVRADRFDLSPQTDAIYLEDYPSYEIVSIAESELSPKLGVIYSVTRGIDVYAQYSHGFRAPPYSDANISLDMPFFAYRAIPNPDLKSESSDGFDIGLRWHGVRASVRFSVFRTEYEDFIESKINLGLDPVSGFTLFQSQNISATEIEGIEAGWNSRFGENESFGFDGAAYYARGNNKDNGQALNSVGPAQATAGFSWYSADETRQLRLKGTFTDAYDRRDETSGDVFKPAGHAVFDLYLTQALGARAVIRAGLHNLTDRTYWYWSDVRSLAPDDPVLPYLAQAGRSASISLNVVW